MFKSSGPAGLYNILPCLPPEAAAAVESLKADGKISRLCEIRLRAGKTQTVTVCGESFYITRDGKTAKIAAQPLELCKSDIAETVFRLCGGSVYSHAHELAQGYISLGGIRVGVCGRGLLKNGIPSGFSEYYSINIRFPQHVKSAADSVLGLLDRRGAEVGGILVVSPPCGGKTTFLRSLAAGLAGGYYLGGKPAAARVCIVDEREEIYLPEVFERGMADIISGLPKAYCIELCTRVMSPDYIVCDEIGNEDEAMAICGGATRGVTFIASCHGKGFDDIVKKRGIARLFEDGVFGTVCELSQKNGERRCVLKNASGEVII